MKEKARKQESKQTTRKIRASVNGVMIIIYVVLGAVAVTGITILIAAFARLGGNI